MRLRFALSLVLVASLSVGSVASAPAAFGAGRAEVVVKLGDAKGFSQIRFEGAQPHSARRQGDDVVLRFGAIAPPDLSLLHVDPPAGLNGAKAEASGGGTEVRLTVEHGAEVKIGRADGGTFVDVYPPPDDASPAGAPADQPPPPRPDPVPASGVVKLEPSLHDGTLYLRFAWRAPLGAAVFRRGDAVWIVFDAKARLDLSQAPHGLPQASRFDPVEGKDFTALRVTAPETSLVSAAGQGGVWTISLGPQTTPPHAVVQVSRDDPGAPTALKADVAGATGVFWVQDPAVGDRLAVVTAREPVKALPYTASFVDADLLASAQGLAVQPNADGLEVKTDGDVVRIARAKGMVLSAASAGARQPGGPALDLPQPAVMPGLVDFAGWSKTGPGGFLPRYDELQSAAAEELGQGKSAGVQRRMGLARFLAGSELSFEAIGVLDMLGKSNPAITSTAEFRGLRGAARVMARRYKDAQADFSAPVLGDDPASALWRGYIDVQVGDNPGARQEFHKGRSALLLFSPKWRARFLRADAEAALATGDVAGARSDLLLAAAEKLDPLETAALKLDQARVAEATGQLAPALALYQAAAQSAYGGVAAPARLHMVQIELKLGKTSIADAVSTLDSLRFRWRGDATELETVRTLADIYFGQGRYREALEALRSAGRNLPDLPAAVAVQTDLSNAFRRLFLEGGADGLQPIEALSIFYDFRNLTPIGADGDLMVRKLAHRLVDVDLLPQASELLKYQADNRLDGVAKAEVATDLATIDLMDRRPEDALDAINASRTTLLPAALNERRRVITARALMGLGRYDDALEFLEKDESPDATDVRAEIAWRRHDWALAGPLFERELGDRWKSPLPLAPDEETRLLRAGIAYSLAQNDAALARLRARFGKLAQDGQHANALQIALSSVQSAPLSPADLNRAMSEADTFEGWVAQTKKRYLSEPLGSPPPGKTAQANAGPPKG